MIQSEEVDGPCALTLDAIDGHIGAFDSDVTRIIEKGFI